MLFRSYEGFNTAWRARQRPTAIVAMADIIAIGALRAARERGVGVPDDLSLIGYDDIEPGALTCPALTTIRQPTVEKGHVAAELLIQRIEQEDDPAEHITLPVELIERQSFARRP